MNSVRHVSQVGVQFSKGFESCPPLVAGLRLGVHRPVSASHGASVSPKNDISENNQNQNTGTWHRIVHRALKHLGGSSTEAVGSDVTNEWVFGAAGGHIGRGRWADGLFMIFLRFSGSVGTTTAT